MTVATEIYYSGYHPYTGERVFCAVSPEEKLAQRQYFFWYDRAYRQGIVASLRRLHRPDLIQRLFPGYNSRFDVSPKTKAAPSSKGRYSGKSNNVASGQKHGSTRKQR